MNKYLLYFIVAAAGAVVLAVEILGTRILGPYYGVSLYLWSALITVTLLSLSLGYTLGGRWADRAPFPDRLVIILASAGLWLLLIPWIKTPLLHGLQPFGLRPAMLIAALLLFSPCLTLLGMISPFAIKLRTVRLQEIGKTAGDLYAVSTIASVAAALTTGFFLIPYFGVQRLTMTAGGLLLLCAALVGWRHGRKRTAALTVIVLVLAGLMMLNFRKMPEGHLALRQSPYGEIRVLDREDIRYLLIDGAVHTAVRSSDQRTMMRYAAAADLTKYFFPNTGDLLLIGLGGGCIAKSFAADGWRVDAVEIDPVVSELAFLFFGLRREDLNLSVMDGRQYLNQNSELYDLVILDAFGSSSIPFHLTTREAFHELSRHLKQDGLLCINVETIGWHHPLVNSLARTLKTDFVHVMALPTSEPPNAAGNILLLAAQRPLTFPEDWLGRPTDFLYDEYAHWSVIQRNHAWDNRFFPDTDRALILTDDLNPSDIWAESINAAVRPTIRDLFATDVW